MISTTHVLIRLKSDIPVRKVGDFLPDGSYLADISGGGQTVRMRVIEYHVTVEGQDVPEMFCLVTELEDDRAYPAGVLAAAHKWRWDGSETALCMRGQVRDPRLRAVHRADAPLAVPVPGPPGTRRLDHRHRADPRHRKDRRPAGRPRRQGPPRRPARPPPRDLLHRRPPRRHRLRPARHRNRQPARPQAITAGCRAVLAGRGRCRVSIDRNRHRDHKTKARQGFPNAPRRMSTRTATAQIAVCGPLTA